MGDLMEDLLMGGLMKDLREDLMGERRRASLRELVRTVS